MKKYIYIPIEIFFPKHDKFLNHIVSRYNIILSSRNHIFKFPENSNINYINDLVKSELSHDDQINFQREVEIFYQFIYQTSDDIIGKKTSKNSIDKIKPELNKKISRAFLTTQSFKKLINIENISLVLTSAEYSGISRPILIEAQNAQIPVVNIEHGFFSALDYASIYKNNDPIFNNHISDYCIVENNLASKILQENLSRSNQNSFTQFIALGSPINSSKITNLFSGLDAKQKLKINPDTVTIGLFGSWCEPKKLHWTLQKQLDEARFYKKIFKYIKSIEEQIILQPIVKFHPAFKVFGEIGVVNYLMDLAKEIDIKTPVFLFDQYQEAICASDFVLTSGNGSTNWEAIVNGKPTAIAMNKIKSHYIDNSKLNSENELVKNGLLTYIINSTDFHNFINKFQSSKKKQDLRIHFKQLCKRWDIRDESVDVISNRICNWIDEKFPGLSVNYQERNGLVEHVKKEGKENMSKPSVNIVIVTYNSASTISNCLLTSINYSTHNTTVTVVDNASRDNTLEILEEFSDKITIIRNKENLGFSAACNQGIKSTDSDYVVLLNPDTIVTENWLYKLLDKFDEGVGAVGPTSDYTGGLQQAIRYLPKEFEHNRATIENVIDQLEKNDIKKVETKLLVGFCMMISKDVLNDIGLLDEELFLGNDDLDYSWRMRLAGYKLFVSTDTFIHHKGQVSFKTEEKSVTDNLVQQSSNILFKKLEKHYGKNNVPTSMELWDNDWFKPTGAVFNPETKLESEKMDVKLGNKKMKIIDTFMYNGDFIVPFRIEYLYDTIDEFIIIESRYTHTGKRKENLFFNEAEFAPWLDKITYLVQEENITEVPEKWNNANKDKYWIQENPLAWYREYSQRNFCIDHLRNEQQNYMLICSDADEIPNRDLLKKIDYNMLNRPLYLEMDMFYYNFNWKKKTKWHQAFFINNIDSGLTEHRIASGEKKYLQNAGWHLSFFMSKEDIRRKLLSFAHTEYSGEEFSADEHIQKCLDEGSELFNRDGGEELVKNDDFKTMPHGWIKLQNALTGSDSEKALTQNSVSEPVVSIIILSYYRHDLLKNCIDSINRNTKVPHELIIVDNNSDMKTRKFLFSLKQSNIRLVLNNENEGFSKGCNTGSKLAKGKFLVFLNNDTEVHSNWLDSMVELVEEDELIGAVGSKFIYEDGLIQNAGLYMVDDKKNKDPLKAVSLLDGKSFDFEVANKLREFQALSGACIMIPSSHFNNVGGFDEKYWNGYEDVDLCLKLREKGLKIVYQPESVITHFESKGGVERWMKVNENIRLLHKNWLGKVVVDVVIEDDEKIQWFDHSIKDYKTKNANKTITQNKIRESEMKPLTSIIILTYNALEYTKKCIKSILEHTSYPYEIVFVDNASTDGTIEYLEKLCSEHTHFSMILNSDNRGFAEGNNQGVNVAKGKYVLLLNNDVLVSNGWLTSMVDALEIHDKIGMVGPVTNSISGLQRIPDLTYNPETEFVDFAKKVRENNNGKISPRRRIAGFAMLLERQLYHDINGFDESFGSGNYEDDDFCLRLRAAGNAIMVDESTFIHHFGSQTFLANQIDYTEAMTDKGKIFFKKWPGVDHEELLEINTPITEIHQEKIKNAMQQIESNNFGMAKKTFNSVLQQNPINGDAIFGLGIVYQLMGDANSALTIFEELKSLYPDFPEIDNHHGTLLYETGDFVRSQEAFANALEKNPDDINAARNLVRTLVKLNEFENAVGLAIEQLNKNPEDEESLMLMAELNVEAGRIEDAKDFLTKITAINPENIQAVQYLQEMESTPVV